jgi:hypothetical protein
MFFIELIILYVFVVWILLRLIVPHLGFSREPIPESIPQELKEMIDLYHQSSKDNFEFLQQAYKYVTSKYTGSRGKTIFQFWRAFGDVYTKSEGFLPCNGQNFLLRTFLVKSGRFSEKDIKIKTIPLNLFLHQYLQVKVGERWIDVDPWSHFLGVPMGKRSAFIG